MNNSIHEVKISVGISKLSVMIPSINLPPITTCRENAPCAKCTEEGGGCYALKGHWMFKNAQKRIWDNLYAYRENPKFFFDSLIIQTKFYSLVRWFSSGDIVDIEFLKGMCRVAKANKSTKYLCFTKKYELVNEFLASGKKIPSNLKIVFSTWGDFIPENPYNLPMSWVMFNRKSIHYQHNALIPKDSIPCSGKCYECAMCWNIKKGQNVVFSKH